MTSVQELFDVLAPKQGTIEDILALLQKKASIPEESLDKVRFLEAHSGKIYRHMAIDFPVSNISDFSTIYAELTPLEEEELADDSADKLVCCFHYEKEPSKTHNVPFLFLVKEGEVFKETKERLSKRSGIKGKAFEKIKFAVIRGGQAYARPLYVDDEDILSEKLASDDQLGLEHANKNRSVWSQHERLNIR